MKIQEIFDLLIEKGYYLPGDYMCNSIHTALEDKVITQKTADKASRLIHNYLETWGESTVNGILIELKRPYRYGGAILIYKDWKNRPRFDIDHFNSHFNNLINHHRQGN